ncbi:uncharacterized protein LOC143918746 [Arctopsyche grandis]|uniref:uncharacterized protein LOC143918746 n=1 Tax=Arctopsyche grandis TaxID=121162 RepID=UPI00406D75BF
MVSVVTGRDRDCWGCRMVSGCGLVGIGAYLATFSKKNPATLGKGILATLSISFAGLGAARIFDLPPFKHT